MACDYRIIIAPHAGGVGTVYRIEPQLADGCTSEFWIHGNPVKGTGKFAGVAVTGFSATHLLIEPPPTSDPVVEFKVKCLNCETPRLRVLFKKEEDKAAGPSLLAKIIRAIVGIPFFVLVFLFGGFFWVLGLLYGILVWPISLIKPIGPDPVKWWRQGEGLLSDWWKQITSFFD
jgi:hypothetical protein